MNPCEKQQEAIATPPVTQTAAKASILSALKVIKSGTMQDLLDRNNTQTPGNFCVKGVMLFSCQYIFIVAV